MANKINRRAVRYGALNSVSGNRLNYNLEGRPTRATEPEATFWHGGDAEDAFVDEEFDRRGHRCCRCCQGRPGRPGRRNAATDCPECETCSGWPLYYTGPCGITEGAALCTGACADNVHITASAQFVAVAPITVSEDGNINFDYESGDDELFREVNGRIRVAYPGRYLVLYTAQIPCSADVCTRIMVTVDDERVFGSEIHIANERSHHTRSYSANALVDVTRGQEIALESTRPFTIPDDSTELPIFTMTIVRIG